MVRVADYVAVFLSDLGVKDIFLLSGGGMMHLLDGVQQNQRLNLVCNLNEQASAICADAYGQYTNHLGVCMLTTGPGGTNGVTGIAAAYLDSTPVLAISGQCKTADFASLRGVRQFGAQEVEIAEVVKPITKYSVKITDKNTIRYHLEKAVYLATYGRKGPVWLDIPLDIQAAQIEPEQLPGYNPQEVMIEQPVSENQLEKIMLLWQQAKRPLILIGHGVVSSGAEHEIRQLVHQLNTPVLATWRAKGVFADNDAFYFGAPGIPTTRYSNYILQNSDFLLIIGTRLNPALTAYDEGHFAAQAVKVIVDLDWHEIEKLHMDFAEKICCDAKVFLSQLLPRISEQMLQTINHDWLQYCCTMKEKYPLSKEVQPYDQGGLTDGYFLMESVSQYAQNDDVIIGSSSGRTCGISHMAFQMKEGQRFISSMGLGSMGFVVPNAIGACLASGKRRTLALEGDGSLQHNLQELQLIQTYALPIKLFVLSNGGYASIYMMQKNNFQEHYAACHPATQVCFPAMEKIAALYHLDYYCIHSNQEVEDVLAKVMADRRPVLCEIKASIYFDEIPKSQTIAHPDGTFSSSKLEQLYPFLRDEELKENMPDWEHS